jgi:hypothetical protein
MKYLICLLVLCTSLSCTGLMVEAEIVVGLNDSDTDEADAGADSGTTNVSIEISLEQQ